MDNKPKGGRGYKAPYETVMVRCPVPVKAEVESLIQRYREAILKGEEWEVVKQQDQIESQAKEEIQVKVTKEEAIARARQGAKKGGNIPKYVLDLIDFVYGDTESEAK
jgi:hypothetical protein